MEFTYRDFMIKDQQIVYPKVKALMAGAFARKLLLPSRKRSKQSSGQQKVLRSLTSSELAKNAGIASGLISYFRQGVRAPNSEQASRLADAFFPRPKGKDVDRLTPERTEFLNGLLAVGDAQASSTGNMLEDLGNGLKLLKLSSAEYAPISGTGDCLFEALATRLFDNCGVPYSLPEYRIIFDPRSILPNEVLLSIFDSPDRMLRLKFWRAPIRMSLGAICHVSYEDKRDQIAQILSYPGFKGDVLLRPIVLPGSVSWSYCRRRLKFTESNLLVPEIPPGMSAEAVIADALLRETRLKKDEIPVICGDEFQCFNALNKLAGEGCSIFPMNTSRGVAEYGPRREMPQYYVGMAVLRGNNEFREYIEDILVQFLSTEIQTTANLWFLLSRKLLNSIRSLKYFPQRLFMEEKWHESERWRVAWEWMKYTLHFDKATNPYSDPAGLPWDPILSRARQLMFHHLAINDWSTVSDQVDLSFELTDHNVSSCVQDLAILFDLDVEAPDRKQATTPATIKEMIRQKLRGDAKGMLFSVDVTGE
jgi:hypothetical protein